MANYASGVNPVLLKWARERAGYSVEDVAESLGKDTETVQLWESGDALPTYSQLEKLAYTLYKRPIAVFFFPEPPEEPDPRQSFRTLPDFEIDSLLPDTRHAIRQAQAIQVVLKELNDGVNPSERKIFRELRFGARLGAVPAAARVRDYLGVSLEKQFTWKNTDQALDAWRGAVQDCGIFVFKRAFKQDDISGFCLSDDEFPVIYLNNSTTKTRQIFSLFHELAHLLLHTSGVTKLNDRFIGALVGDAKEIEMFCNRFTAEFLVPSEDFDTRISPNVPIDELTENLARRYKVSREVILRMLLDRELVDSLYYESKVAQWLQEYIEWRASMKGGGNYYATQVSYFGDKFLNLAFGKYYQGACTIEQLADYLSVKVKSVPGLEQLMLKKASGQ